ncbi:hypothetical protein V2O64_19835 [Verrucomicrobiaceae bacterium 227]
MKRRPKESLLILSGVACLVVAGWVSFDRFVGTNDSPESKSLRGVASSRKFSSGNERNDSQPRSLEELNGILRAAKEEWRQLEDTRYFFQDYADEVVSEFSLEEIRLLGFERTGHDVSSVVGFHYAIMRRWGELDYSGALARIVGMMNFYGNALSKAHYLSLTEEEKKADRPSGLKEEVAQAEPLIFSEKERAALRKLGEVESYPGYYMDFFQLFHRNLLDEAIIGGVRGDPVQFVSQIIETNRERQENGDFDRSNDIEDSRTLEEAFRRFAEHDPKEAQALMGDKEKLELISPWDRRFGSGQSEGSVNALPLVRGYFSGLPDDSKWLRIYESLDPEYQGDSLAPMLARWMDEDADEASSWIQRQVLPEGLFEAADDPFGSSFKVKSLEPQSIDRHSLLLGHAAGIWFHRHPEEASNWISQNLQNLTPGFFEGSLLEVVSASKSPTGFLAILEKIRDVENVQMRGRAILSFQQNMEFFTSMFPYSYEWREERRILEFLKTIELDANHREDLDVVIKKAESSIESMSGTKGTE